jgi:hypothetical protein
LTDALPSRPPSGKLTNSVTCRGVSISMNRRILALVALLSASTAPAVLAQGIVVDQGQFAIRIGGRLVGTEEFVIRRAGLGRDDAVFANGVVSLTVDGSAQEIRPLLRATPPEGTAASYQVDVSGADSMGLRLARVGRRYVATINSAIGDEDREFQARPDTRVLELGVAHHYYFLRNVREGSQVHALEPRSRRQVTLAAGARVVVDLRLGANVVSARRVEFASDQGDDRTVWFDRQGRVLRVEIPSRSYVAERKDLVG